MTTTRFQQSDYKSNVDQTDGRLHTLAYQYQDSPAYDAFGRQRTSNTAQRLDVEFIYNTNEELFDEITTNGTITHNANTRDVTLSLSSANSGDKAEIRSHPTPYTPGNSQLIDITGVLDLANIGGGTAEVFVRSKISGTVAETTYAQSTWESNKTGVNWNYSHIFSMDFQSLKVGRIRFFLVQNGLPVQVKEVHNDNVRNSGYWQLPSLPVYWNLYCDATYTYMEIGYGNTDNAIGFRYKILANASATMKAICCTVKSEGGNDLKDMEGFNRSIDMGVTPLVVGTTLVPLISIRPKSTFKTFDNLAIMLPRSFSIQTDNPIRIVILHDTTLTGASWVDVDTAESAMEYDITATAYTGGHAIFRDYISTSKNTVGGGAGLLGKVVLWNRLGTETGIITIAAVRTTATSASVLAGINWTEIR